MIKVNLKTVPPKIDLDNEQYAAVNWEGSVLLIGVPGGGKTRCIQAISYNTSFNTLGTTFNAEAAREMRRRCSKLIEVRDIHSLSLRETGYLPTDSNGDPDFDSLLDSYIEYPMKHHYSTLILDELHTFSRDNWKIVQDLTPHRIFAVGDPYQLIYTFRGAYRGIFEDLEKWGCKVMYLHNNYRSSQAVVDVLEAVYKRGMIAKGPSSLNNSIGILAKTNQDLHNIEQLLLEANVAFESHIRGDKKIYGDNPHIFLYTIHASIGLEFDTSCVIDWYGEMNLEEINILYVGLSRARETCYVVRFPYTKPGLAQALLGSDCPAININDMIKELKKYEYSRRG
jgi:superfamily I DNA/RNA helicase